MKKIIAALLAGLLLLSLAACKQNEPPLPTPEPPPVQEPEKPEKPPVQELPETPDAGLEPPAAGAAAVRDNRVEGSVEESVSYSLCLPELTAQSESATQTINDYYKLISGKLGDLAWGEVYEQALDAHTVMALTADYTVEFNQDNLISVSRMVCVEDRNTGAMEQTMSAETFNLENGGLMTLDDMFSVPAEEYVPRLTALVRTQIENEPYHDKTYVDQWESLLEASFDKTSFYLREEGLSVFYQPGELGPELAQAYLLRWETLQDILKSV